MKKQIKKKSEALITPLRLTADEAAALQQLQEYLKESTRNGTVVKAIIRYKNIYQNLQQSLEIQTQQRNKLSKLRQYFLMMDEAESEIKKILESN